MPSTLEALSLDALATISGGTDWARIRSNASAGAYFGAAVGTTFAAGMLVGGPVGVPAAAATVGAFTAGGAAFSAAADYLAQRSEARTQRR
jgi:hypothetical protein